MIVYQDKFLGNLLITLVSVQHCDTARTLLTRLHVECPEICPGLGRQAVRWLHGWGQGAPAAAGRGRGRRYRAAAVPWVR